MSDDRKLFAMVLTFLLLLALAGWLVMRGSSGDEQQHKAIIEFGKVCNTTVSAKLILSEWGNSIELSCSDVGKKNFEDKP